jgi:hypothetical protein
LSEPLAGLPASTPASRAANTERAGTPAMRHPPSCGSRPVLPSGIAPAARALAPGDDPQDRLARYDLCHHVNARRRCAMSGVKVALARCGGMMQMYYAMAKEIP